jgi:mono/diheme cytochrome c family protein
LYPFASRPWLAGLLDKKQIKSSRYFGHTRFASGIMVKYVEADFASVDEADRTAIVAALSAEARLPSQAEADARDKDLIAKGRELIASTGCTRCHRFREHGVTGEAPDLTGYGSREWLIGITADPTHPWFYAERNDGMPAHVESPEEPAKNRLSERQVETLVSWMRGEWFEPGAGSGQSAASQAPVAVTLGKWLARRGARETRVADAKGQALGVLRLAQCALCHDCSGVGGEGLAARQPSAPSLSGYASAEWFRGLLDPTQVAGPKYFGTNDEFADGEMVGFVQDDLKDNMISAGEIALEDMISEAAENEKQVEFALQHLAELKPQIGEEELRKRADEAVKSDKFEDFVKENGKTLIERLGQEKLEQLIATLAAEAQKDTSAEVAEDTEALFEDLGCADCHKFYNAGELGSAPDLTGYGSQQWLIGIITNPEEERFYRSKNDGMPAYHAFPKEPKKNLLTPEQIEQLAALLRGKL